MIDVAWSSAGAIASAVTRSEVSAAQVVDRALGRIVRNAIPR